MGLVVVAAAEPSAVKVAESPASEWQPRREFLDRFFAALAPLGYAATPSAQWHGIRVGLWSEFDPLLNAGPAAWLAVFGLRPPGSTTLCLLRRYSVSHVHPLVRPATIDGAWCPEHFPNPSPDCGWVGPAAHPMGGHPIRDRRPFGLRAQSLGHERGVQDAQRFPTP
jgi:hypothetical protein